MNLVRLAWFNIKKHKSASLSLVILIFFCQLFLGLGVHNIHENGNLFEDKAQTMDSIQNIYCIEEDIYKSEYEQILKEDPRVSKVVVQDGVLLWDNTVKLKDGEDYNCTSLMLNEKAENVLEKIKIEEQREKEIEHPIYAPFIMKEYYGFRVGDPFTILYHQQQYTFEIAGFYETTVFANGNMGAIKYFISDEDYQKLYSTWGGIKILGYNAANLNEIKDIGDDFVSQTKSMAYTADSFKTILTIGYNLTKSVASLFPVLLAYLLLFFSIIIFITVFIVIRHRITSNIEEQMTSIGTLGALGYTSGQITRAYVIEYGLLAGLGALLGIIGSKLIMPIVSSFSFTMLGLKSAVKGAVGLDICMFIGIIGLVAFTSFTKASRVKKYPPVVAFRKGINNHHFKKNYFALVNTKTTVHFRLAGKRFMGAIKQNVIVSICIMAATAVMMFSVILFNCCGKDQSVIGKLSGFEICDVNVNITHSIQAEVLKEELLGMPEVRKVNLSHSMMNVSLANKDILAWVFQDYNEVESISTYEGRLPIYDNEVVITGALANKIGKKIGDGIEIENNGFSMTYLISGISQSMINMGETFYFTEEGIKHIYPSYQSNQLDIYLEEGVDKGTFISKLKEKYGKSIEEAKKGETQDISDRSKRIKAKAEERIASLMSLYGVDSIDYAIMIDGVLIKGNSKSFAIDKITDMEMYVKTNIGAYVQGVNWGTKVIMGVAAIIIVVILFMVIRASIIRQKLDLGTYKGLGYTTKELMLQITISLMPAVTIGIIAGILIAIAGSPSVLAQVFSNVGITNMMVDVNVIEAVGLGLGIFIFSFAIAMLSAYKIKEISVYELLSE